MSLVAACLADELALALSVGSLAMTTRVTGLTGVGRVDELDRHACQSGLVHDEVAELGKAPGAQSILRITAPSRNPNANPLQVLKGNSASGAFGGLNDLF